MDEPNDDCSEPPQAFCTTCTTFCILTLLVRRQPIGRSSKEQPVNDNAVAAEPVRHLAIGVPRYTIVRQSIELAYHLAL